jgi:hypothetical protein
MVKVQRVRIGAVVVFALAVSACTGAGAATTIPANPAATERPSLSASPSPAPSVAESMTPTETAAPTVSAAPSRSAKPLPSFDQADLDAILTSSITLIDLADDDLAVTVSYLDPSSDQSFDMGTYTLGTMEQTTYQVPPGTYRLAFRQPASSATGPSCTIEIGDAGGYVFAALQDAVAISRTDVKPKDARELFISTSSLCGK